MRRPLAVVLFVLALPLVVTACGDTTNTVHPSMSGPPMGGMGHGGASPVASGARRIDVDATSFEFMPSEITVTAGEDIAISLTSRDLLHDFTVDELDAHVSADKGETAEGGLRADKPGRYTYYCSVTGHRAAGMEGTLIVETS